MPVLLSGIPVSAYSRSRFTQLLEVDSDRVLVLIQLNGGNDGLATVVPLDQYDKMTALRPNIVLPESSILNLDGSNGLHPSMSLMKNLYDEKRLSIIQGVAYPNQNRSHFRSTDIWHSASEADEYLDTGWLGRHFYQDLPEYPDDFPNDDNPDPVAITLGLQVSETCQGPIANYSIAINGENSLSPINETEGDETDNTCYGREVSFIRETIKQLNAYSEVVGAAFEKGINTQEYPDGNPLAQQLRLVAKLIAGGLKTKIYVVSIGGFDTHANQVDDSDPRQGDHATLLGRLSEGISLFQSDLESLGLSEKVVGMTYSEFGRRIRSNGSLGTDHGTAAPLILFGNCVNGEIIGSTPDLQGDIDQNEGVAMQYDFRSVYASILMDWFGAEENDLRNYLYEDFQYIPLINGCQSTSVDDTFALSYENIHIYPNPCSDVIHLAAQNLKGDIILEIFNVYGYRVMRESRGGLTLNSHQINTSSLPSGNYVLRIQSGVNGVLKKFIKL
jgi:uncharacterized protein (DUF1501 family)